MKRNGGSVKLSLRKALLKAMNSDHLGQENSSVGPTAVLDMNWRKREILLRASIKAKNSQRPLRNQ